MHSGALASQLEATISNLEVSAQYLCMQTMLLVEISQKDLFTRL